MNTIQESLKQCGLLLQINYSPAVMLNCTYALYKAGGKETAREEAEKLQLNDNRFYYVLLGELYSDTGKKTKEHLLQHAHS